MRDLLQILFLLNCRMRIFGDDDVLDEGDAEKLSGVFEAGGDVVVLGRGLVIAGRMIVGDDDGSGIVLKCGRKDVARMDDTRVHGAD